MGTVISRSIKTDYSYEYPPRSTHILSLEELESSPLLYRSSRGEREREAVDSSLALVRVYRTCIIDIGFRVITRIHELKSRPFFSKRTVFDSQYSFPTVFALLPRKTLHLVVTITGQRPIYLQIFYHCAL